MCQHPKVKKPPFWQYQQTTLVNDCVKLGAVTNETRVACVEYSFQS